MSDSRKKRIREALLKVLKDEYGGSDEDWVAGRSLDRVVSTVDGVVGFDFAVSITTSAKGSECQVFREGALVFDGVSRGHAVLAQQSGCTHIFPDGTRCQMAIEQHQHVIGLAELHGIKK